METRISLLFFAAALAASTLSADPVLWQVPLGNWSNNANWFPHPPASTSDVTIGTGTATLDTNATIASLTLDNGSGPSATLQDASTSQTLAISGALTINTNGNVSFTNSSLTANSISNAGSFQLLSGNASGATGNFSNSGSASVSGSFLQRGTLDINGTLTNSGTFNSSNTGLVNVTGNLNNSGSLGTVSDSAFQVSGSLTNTGSVSIGKSSDIETPHFTNANGAGLTVLPPDKSDLLPFGGSLLTNTYTSGGLASVQAGAILQLGTRSALSGYSQDTDGTLEELIYGPAAGSNNGCTGFTDCGMIQVSNGAYLSGTLDPELQGNHFDPANGESFVFLTFSGTHTGPGFTLENPYFNNNTQQWVLSYGDGFAELTAEAHTPPSVSEPSTVLLLGMGLVGGAVFGRKQCLGTLIRHAR